MVLNDLGLHCNWPGLQIPFTSFLHTSNFSENFLSTEAYKKPNGESVLQDHLVSFMLTVIERNLSIHRTTRKKVKTRLCDINTSWCWILMLLFRLPMHWLHRQTQSSSTANLKTPLALMRVLLNFFTADSSIIPINMTNELCSQNIRSKTSLGWADLLQW